MIVIPTRMGRLNMRTLLRRLQKVGTASRADLAKSLGMSQPTAGRIVDELLELGVLEEISAADSGETAGRLGRPGRLLRLDSTQPRFLGIHLGISETTLCVLPVGYSGEENSALRMPTPASPKASAEELAQQWLKGLQTAAVRLPRHEWWGILISVPGIVDENAGKVLFSPNLHWTERVDLPRLANQLWKGPVILIQEERALALGHQTADTNNEDFLLVDFGEGVGGAVIIDGKLYANPLPLSGELGHTPIIGNQRPCGCGAVGCIETLVSTRGILLSFAATQRNGAKATWPALADHIAKDGLPKWLADALEATAGAIAGALNVLGLRRVVITGSLTELPPLVVQHLSAAIVRGAMWARFGRIECEAAARRRMAGLVSAGIDRLVISMADQHEHEPAATAESAQAVRSIG